MMTHTTLEDVHAIEPTDQFDMDWRAFLDQVADPKTLSTYLATYCRTVWFGEQRLAIGGVTPLWDGVGELWICLDRAALEHRVVMARYLRRLMDAARTVLSAHRLQITVPPAAGDEWRETVEWLGFREEGTLHSYIQPGEDYALYAWCKEGSWT